jgi:membrane peptidoglycan carboxypeptidase
MTSNRPRPYRPSGAANAPVTGGPARPGIGARAGTTIIIDVASGHAGHDRAAEHQPRPDHEPQEGAAPAGGREPRPDHAEATAGVPAESCVPGPDPDLDSDSAPLARGRAQVGAGIASVSGRAARRRRQRQRRRRLIVLTSVLAVLSGLGMVVGSLFFESVQMPESLDDELAQSSVVYFADGETAMGTLGTEKRVNVDIESDVPEHVIWALLAAEDRNFYEHDGVDFFGVLRALWNNVSGGDTQGASTLTQQYVGTVQDIRNDGSYLRKAKEAVMAMKMDDAYDKDEILERYLNLVYMGRGAYGIGAAARAWFGTEVSELDASQAALIFAQVKQPDGAYDPRDPLNIGESEAKANATQRWNYILDSMVEVGRLSQRDRDRYEELPATVDGSDMWADNGAEDDTGFVSHRYVLEEIENELGISKKDLLTGGYQITTTIDNDLQNAAVAAASREDGGPMAGQQKGMRAALVSVEPGTGRMQAYYGGADGTGVDKAGYESMHAPGSSFKAFTLAAALKAGISYDSWWNGSSPRTFPQRDAPVSNSGDADGESYPSIRLIDAIRKSLNTPVYALTNTIGAVRVAETAHDLGIRRLIDPTTGDLINLESAHFDHKNPRSLVDNEIGFGQYPVSVRDMATANATLANDGVYVAPHFVKQVKDPTGKVVYSDTEGDALHREEAVSRDVARDATYVLSTIHPVAGELANGQPSAGKTGTWERSCKDECDENSAVWYAGYTPHLAAAVWVGDEADENAALIDAATGGPAYGSGVSGSVWKTFMDKATEVEHYPVARFQPPAHGGDPDKGEQSTEPARPTEKDDCADNPDADGCAQQCQPGDDGCGDDEAECGAECGEEPAEEDECEGGLLGGCGLGDGESSPENGEDGGLFGDYATGSSWPGPSGDRFAPWPPVEAARSVHRRA